MPFANIEDRRKWSREYYRKWRLLNPEKVKEISKRSAEKNKEQRKQKRLEKYTPSKRYEQKLRLDFGLTLDQYYEMLEKQGGACAICRCPPSGKQRLAVDHSHVSGKVRELLCGSCNRALGLFHEDRFSLQNAIDYLSKHREDDWLSELEQA